MIKKGIVAMLAVAAISLSAVSSFAAEAGVLGLKPSANQSSNSSTGTTTNKEVPSDIVYDTNKYQYPAQQLIAEGRQFDRYNWRLYQRFADGQFDYKAWANNLGYVAVDYSDNNNSTENNVVTSNFNLKDWNNPYINGPLTWDDTGKKIFQTDNDIIFPVSSHVSGPFIYGLFQSLRLKLLVTTLFSVELLLSE